MNGIEASGGTPTRSVFISYRRGSETLDQWVCGLADDLSNAGLDVQLDQWIRNPSGGWGPWSRRGIETSNFVLSVCTPGYRAAFDQTEGEEGKGVHWEGHYIEQCLYEARAQNDRFIPILLEDGSELDIPGPLRGGTFYRLPHDADALLTRLLAQSDCDD